MKPRLHVLLASSGHTGVVLRRGPAREVAAIGWNRDNDTFVLGQWLRGRIYELRCDLSPDGEHLIYFAMNGHWGSRAKGAWTAISRAPYLTAIALFAKGDCWHGGGLFTARGQYWLNDGYGHTVLDDTTEVTRAPATAYRPTWGGECRGVYFHRLLRDGWTLRSELAIDGTEVFERPLWHGWVLRKLTRVEARVPGKAIYFDEHELVHLRSGRELMRHGWEWASPDLGRLVWAEAGALWAGKITKRSATGEDPVTGAVRLRDFSDMRFEQVIAPYAPRPKR